MNMRSFRLFSILVLMLGYSATGVSVFGMSTDAERGDVGEKRRASSDPEMVDYSIKRLRSEGFRFDIFSLAKTPNILCSVLNAIQSQYQNAETLIVQWQYSGGFYYFKAYHRDDMKSFLRGKKSTALSLKQFAKWCRTYVDNQDFIDGLLCAELERSNFEKQADESSVAACKRMLAQHYKIHLMPTPENFEVVLEKILQAFIDNHELRSLVQEFKVNKKFMNLVRQENVTREQILQILAQDDHYMPILIVYPQDGKESAQRVLDILMDLLDEEQGIDVTPRFNQKVTPLIYYAQGNGDDKVLKDLQRFFESDLVHFREDFTGAYANYRLEFDGAQACDSSSSTSVQLPERTGTLLLEQHDFL